MTLRATAWLLPLSLSLGISGQALAQATVPAQPPPAGTPSAPPEIVEPPPPGEAPAGTEQLQRSDGVVKPPQGVDPGIVKPPPDDGAARMPVIPPPPTSPPAN